MSTTMQLAQGAVQTAGGITDDGLVRAAAMLAGGAIGAAQGNGTINAAVVSGVARQPEARGRLTTASIIGISLVESAYFINLAFMALFVFNLAR